MSRLHEYRHEEEFYAKFIHIEGDHSVLVFNYGDGTHDLAEKIASLMDGKVEWVEDYMEFVDREEPHD